MIDRTINLLSIFIFLVALIVLAVNVNDSWTKTEPWEQKWIAIKNVEQKYDSDKLIIAIKKAHEQNEYSDVYTLEETLESMYKPSGEILTRFNAYEIQQIVEYVLLTLLFLVVPVSINYVRHGKFKLWNVR